MAASSSVCVCDVWCEQLDSKNSPLAMLARTCNSIGKDSQPSKAAHQSQHQQQSVDKKENSTGRLIKSTSPGKKSSLGVDGAASRKDLQSSTSSSALSRQSTAAAAGRRRSSLSPTSSRLHQYRDDEDTSSRRAGDGWPGLSDSGRAPHSGAGSPASTSRTADSDRDSVDDLRCSTGRHHRDRAGPQVRQTTSPYSSSDVRPASLGLYESLRLQQEAAALQAAAVYSPLHHLLAQQRQLADPLAMYSASLQAAAVVAAAAAAQANLGHPARLPGKDYRLGDVSRPCGVDATDLVANGDVDASVFSAAGLLPLRPTVPTLAHPQQPYTCSWLISGGEFCARRFSTSEELFAHLRTHVDGAAAPDDQLRSALPSAASCYPPSVAGFLAGPSSTLPLAGTFGGVGASLAAAHAATSSFYRGKVQRSGRSLRDAASTSPTSTAGAGGGSLLLHAAAAAAAASSRYHPYKWTPSPFIASALGTAAGLPNSDLTPSLPPPALSAFLQQPPYAGLFSAAQTLGAAVP